MKALYEEFGRDLRKARRKRGLTQQQLGDRIGLSRTSITNMEKGRQQITLHQLYFISSALGCKLDDLLPDPPAALEDLVPQEAVAALAKDPAGRDFAVRVLRKSGGVGITPKTEVTE